MSRSYRQDARQRAWLFIGVQDDTEALPLHARTSLGGSETFDGNMYRQTTNCGIEGVELSCAGTRVRAEIDVRYSERVSGMLLEIESDFGGAVSPKSSRPLGVE